MKFVWWWLKGSAALVGLLIISLIFKTGMEPLVEVSSPTLSWILTFLLALSPVGGLLGYIVIFFVKLLLSMIGIGGDDKESSHTSSASTVDYCPFAGVVYVNRDMELFGRHYSANSEAFEIQNDWTIHTYADGKVGWVDKRGEIHGVLPLLSNVDPDATLSGGNIGLNVSHKDVWMGNTKVGYIR